MNKYLLVSSNAYSLNESVVAAYEVANERLKRNVWPLYRLTSFAKTISTGDQCMIYASGARKFGGTIIASAEVKDVEVSRRMEWFELETLQVPSPERVLHFSKTVILEKPIPLYPLVEFLELTGFQNKNWGAYMQGGCRKLSDNDFETITSKNK